MLFHGNDYFATCHNRFQRPQINVIYFNSNISDLLKSKNVIKVISMGTEENKSISLRGIKNGCEQ